MVNIVKIGACASVIGRFAASLALRIIGATGLGRPLTACVGQSCLMLLLLLAGPVLAEDKADKPVTGAPIAVAANPPSPLSAEFLQSRLKELEANTALKAEVKEELTKLIQKGLLEINAAQGFDASAKNFAKILKSAPGQVETLRKALSMSAPKIEPKDLGISQKTILADLEKLLAAEQRKRFALETELADLESQLQQQTSRASAARKRLEEARQELQQLTEGMAQLDAQGEPVLVEAHARFLQLRQATLKAEIAALDLELQSQPQRMDLLQAQQDLSARALSLAKELVDKLTAITEQLREQEVQQAKVEAKVAERTAASKHPLLGKLAEENSRLIAEIAATVQELEQANVLAEQTKAQIKVYQTQFSSLKKKLEIAGLSGGVHGLVLLEERLALPDVRILSKRLAKRERVTATVALRQISYNEQRRKLADMARATDEALLAVEREERTSLREEVLELVGARRELLDKAITETASYTQTLIELDFSDRQSITQVQEYDKYLSEKLLWIPSDEVFGWDALLDLPSEVGSLLSWSNWLKVIKALFTPSSLMLPVLVVLLVVVVLFWFTPAMRRRVLLTGEWVSDPLHDRVSYSFLALLLVCLRAISWPLLMWLVAVQLDDVGTENQFVHHVAQAFRGVAKTFFLLRLFWILCEPGGVAMQHFRLPTANVHFFRRQLGILSLLLVPAVIVFLAASIERPAVRDLGLIFIMTTLSFFLIRVMQVASKDARWFTKGGGSNLLAHSRYLWFPLTLALPFSMLLLVVLGYFYTAEMIVRCFLWSLLLVIGLLVVRELVLRWMLIRLRAARRAKMERELQEHIARDEDGELPIEQNIRSAVSDTEVDLDTVDSQTKKLLRISLQLGLLVGLWGIWSPLLPAFEMLHSIELWKYTVTEEGHARQVPVTLASFALGLGMFALTWVSARNIPSVIEIFMLKKMTLDAGTRYAYTTLARYLVTGIGVIIAFSILGGSWSQIQWLVAALGVGIGFGLQEIVANFISGIIILFERPIRVGDVVTVGNISGVVSRIRIRATTITNWDRQELLVPNKEFITSQLLNWSLSDPIIRITVNVGIDYGSNVQRALAIMEEVAAAHGNVLADPPPLITFDSFGDNTLNLKMRCYLPDIDRRAKTISELHLTIHDRFHQEGIGIAFPQRDVHLDTLSPLDIRIVRQGKGEGQAARDPGNSPKEPPLSGAVVTGT